MQRHWLSSGALAAFVTLMMVAALPGGLASAQEKAKADKAKAEKKLTGRLPAHYAQVVDEKQRETIYKIQQEYGPKLKALREQLDALTKEQDAKVAGVLTPEQRKKVEELQAAAKKMRDEKKPEAGKQPPPPKSAEKPAAK